jgi:hypothetical protein
VAGTVLQLANFNALERGLWIVHRASRVGARPVGMAKLPNCVESSRKPNPIRGRSRDCTTAGVLERGQLARLRGHRDRRQSACALVRHSTASSQATPCATHIGVAVCLRGESSTALCQAALPARPGCFPSVTGRAWITQVHELEARRHAT